MLVEEILRSAVKVLKKSHIHNPRLDAEVLLSNRMHVDRSALITLWDAAVEPEVAEGFKRDIERRSAREPVAYIIGKKEFMGLEFIIEPCVLIPRPDTEVLVEKTLELSQANNQWESILEIGVGSGAIAVSLAKYNDKMNITAVDIDKNALSIAKQNAIMHGVEDRISFIESDIFENIADEARYDCIVSNPPYINKEDMCRLDDDVKEYEPHLALYGGIDGLDFYRRIIEESVKHLKEDGLLIFEIGYDQGEEVKKVMESNGFQKTEIIKDLSGLDRVVLGFLG